METPSGKKVEPTITPLPDEPGKYEIAYVPEETGPHKLNVKYGKDHVKDSPFRLKVAPGGDASKVKVSGEGIEKPRVGQLVDIIFDTTEAGQGGKVCCLLSPLYSFYPLLSRTQLKTLQACCMLSILPTCCNSSILQACCNLSTNFNNLVNYIKLQQVC